MRIKIALSVMGLCLGGALIVAWQNTDVVQLQFLFWSSSVSLLRVVLGSVLAGFLAGFAAALTMSWRGRARS